MKHDLEIKALSKLVIDASNNLNICREIALEIIKDNTSFYARYKALETLVFAQDALLNAVNRLSCETIKELHRLLDEQTFISESLIKLQQTNEHC